MSDTAQDNNSDFNAIANNLHSIVYRRKNNKSWEIEYVNHGCFKVTGHDFKEFMEDKGLLGKIILEEDKKQAWDTIQKAIKTRQPFNIHYRIRHKNGSIKYVWEQGEGFFTKNNKVIVLEGFITDITSQKKLEQELKTEHIRNKVFLQALPDILFVVDPEGVYIDAQAQDLTMLGLTKEELIGKSIHEVLPKAISSKIMKALRGNRKNGDTKVVEFELPILEELKHFEARIVAKEKGNFLIITRDITEQKILEKELKESEAKNKTILLESKKQLEKYSANLEQKVQERTEELKDIVQKLVETNINLEDQIQATKVAEGWAIENQNLFVAIARNFPQGIIAVANKDYTIEYIEGEELKILGLKDRILKGAHIDEIGGFSEDLRLRLKDDIKKTLTGQHLAFEVKYQNKIFTVHSAPLFDNYKKITRALFVYIDISKQKQVESEVRKALEKEHELNELKSRFISTASHEFRTPLSAILSSAALIERQNEDGKEAIRKRHVHKIESNVKNLVTILDDFLSLSKLEEGKIKAQPRRFDLVEFCKTLIKEIEPSKKEGQRITLATKYNSIWVHLDPKLLNHIILNLLSNSIKYSGENKEISLAITRKGGQITLAITDQGIGIPEEDQEKLFHRFFRAKNVENIEGTGLGLNIVEQYTELMGGTVHLKSEVLKGTTFFVELPNNLKEDEKNIDY